MKYIFGPVLSRRLGFSLGIDLIPFKTCNLNCVYCECGLTTDQTMERKEYFPKDEIVSELKHYFTEMKKNDTIDFVTVTGSGDPLLHSELGTIITEIKRISTVPVAILTNGILLTDEKTRAEAALADVLLPSLDAGNEKTFKKINRPLYEITIRSIMDSFKKFREEYPHVPFWLEIVFVAGINDDDENVKQLACNVRLINPDRIQLNTVVRPPAVDEIMPVSTKRMHEIKQFFGQKASIIFSSKSSERDVVPVTPDQLFKIVKRRPVPIEELQRVTGSDPYTIKSLLKILENQNKIIVKVYGDKEFATRA